MNEKFLVHDLIERERMSSLQRINNSLVTSQSSISGNLFCSAKKIRNSILKNIILFFILIRYLDVFINIS